MSNSALHSSTFPYTKFNIISKNHILFKKITISDSNTKPARRDPATIGTGSVEIARIHLKLHIHLK